MKEKIKNVYEFLKKPNLLFKVISYVSFFVCTIITLIMLYFGVSEGVMTLFYSLMGITFFYGIYLFVLFDYKSIRNYYKIKKEMLSSKNKFINGLINDMYFRTMITSSFSLLMSICFVVYNAFVGLYYHSIWNGSISIYYGFLVGIRVLFLSGEYSFLKKKNMSDEKKEYKRANMFKKEGILLLCLNIALVVPVTLLVFSKKDVNLPMWVVIGNAAYTFYKVTMCIISFAKSRKHSVLSVRGLKNLNLTDAIVSLLSLENTMIITFSEGNDNSMHILMIISSFAFTLCNIFIAISTLKKGKNEVKTIQNNKEDEENV